VVFFFLHRALLLLLLRENLLLHVLFDVFLLVVICIFAVMYGKCILFLFMFEKRAGHLLSEIHACQHTFKGS
jgi:hypothetical protein